MIIFATGTTSPGLSDFLSNVTAVVQSVASMVGQWVSVIVEQPLILMAVLLPLTFIGIRALRLLLGQSA